jgi:hypothetical protein
LISSDADWGGTTTYFSLIVIASDKNTSLLPITVPGRHGDFVIEAFGVPLFLVITSLQDFEVVESTAITTGTKLLAKAEGTKVKVRPDKINTKTENDNALCLIFNCKSPFIHS